MTDITFHGGVKDIGGNKFLVDDKGTKIFMDFGMSFSAANKYFSQFVQPRTSNSLNDMFEMGLLPKIKGLYRRDYARHMDFGGDEDSEISAVMMGLFVVSINLGNTTFVDQKNEIIHIAELQGESLQEPADMNRLAQELKEIPLEQILASLVAIPVLLIYHFPYFAGMMAIEDDLTSGFFMHFSIVGFVEILEMVGVLIFYKITFRKSTVNT